MPPKKGSKVAEDEEVITWYETFKVRKSKKNITLESHLAKLDGLLQYLSTEIEKRSKAKEKGVRVLLSAKKVLKEIRKETPCIAHRRRPRDPSLPLRGGSGFTQEYPISEELASFLHLEGGEAGPHLLSRLDATRAICVYAHLKDDEQREEILKWAYLNPDGKRNLQNANDKKAIVPDIALSRLLHYDEYKKAVKAGTVTKKVTVDKDTGKKEDVVVTSDALYYWTVQRLLNRHFIRE